METCGNFSEALRELSILSKENAQLKEALSKEHDKLKEQKQKFQEGLDDYKKLVERYEEECS
jgi:FtsZ-binding cell division protein ZapB